ncbi:AKAP7 2'5' RNA ligase-like domain-containing protein [Mycena rosella]|uniref:AKAP7 2'5' RNA ligase-like domain-containing protein n=1 Tax=Mycena rosella TaxID=1033263 RepID=A0AAD7DEX4_MYCRO|nr:AKAP7 2'5' RNA ligase-like domain-containing protein [Mycena rosella]
MMARSSLIPNLSVLSLPLGHHPGLRERIREFHQSLLTSGGSTTPDVVAIEGLDRSILVDPRRLHFTIGVMTLTSKDESETSKTKTLRDAISLLHSLAPEINEIAGQPVVLPLDKMGVLKTKRQQAGVLYVGPADETNESAIKLGRIFDLVAQRFRVEGFIKEESRPSVLHCTLINASHRKPRRMPRTFSYREIFDRATVEATSPGPSEIPRLPSDLTSTTNLKPEASVQQEREVRVDFGAWAVSEIQLCQMGSHGPENEYVSCASIPLEAN